MQTVLAVLFALFPQMHSLFYRKSFGKPLQVVSKTHIQQLFPVKSQQANRANRELKTVHRKG